jgi:tetratricopeptide (TPR) repeat protein
VTRARRAFERDQDPAALTLIDALIEGGARYADVHYMLGMIRERQNDLPGAIEALREAIQINPAYCDALLALAGLYERTGHFDRARTYAERASHLTRPLSSGLDPITSGKLANQQAALADALAAAGERRDAIEQYRGALNRCPDYHDIRHRLAVALREAGLPAQAIREFERILQHRPRMLESRVQLGLTYYSMARAHDAITQWRAVLRADPRNDEAQRYLRIAATQESGVGTASAARPTVAAETRIDAWRRAPVRKRGGA